jgi:hypothetical protein
MGGSNFLHFKIIVLILFIFSSIWCQIFHLCFLGSSFHSFFLGSSFFDFCSSWVDLIFSSFWNHCVAFVYFLLFLVLDFSFILRLFFFFLGSSFFDFCCLARSNFLLISKLLCSLCFFFLCLVVVTLLFFGFFLFVADGRLLLE